MPVLVLVVVLLLLSVARAQVEELRILAPLYARPESETFGGVWYYVAVLLQCLVGKVSYSFRLQFYLQCPIRLGSPVESNSLFGQKETLG